MEIDPKTLATLLRFQKNEITEHHIYRALAAGLKSEKNRTVLQDIADDELRHYHEWQVYTRQEVRPDRFKVFFYGAVSRLFGLTFGLKLMESGEGDAKINYGHLAKQIPEAARIAADESEHEKALLGLLDEDSLRYTGSMVLGMNDALVELTGTLAGFTFALQNTKLIALTGAITGFAAGLSMASSEYLSTKAEDTKKNPLKASVYTGIAYFITVIVLILPYFLFHNQYLCLACCLALAIGIIAIFNFYISVAKGLGFRRRFLEMAGISILVASLSFVVGYALRLVIKVDI
jgi:vacuolar iron transporter family protein